MTRNERDFKTKIRILLNPLNNFMNDLRRIISQLFCWHDLHDEYSIRTHDWGRVMEDKYYCSKCRAIVWVRRKRYVDGSWVKDSPN